MDRLKAALERLGTSCGWKRRVAGLLAGVFATLALPPVYFFPALYAGFAVLYALNDGAKGKRQAFADGWFFGFGYFAASLYWIANALLVFSDRLWWMVPFAAIGLPVFFAFYTGFATFAACYAKRGAPRVFALIAAWSAGEWLRGHLFTGFPWNMNGLVWNGSEALLQTNALIGAYGTSFIATASVLFFARAIMVRDRVIRIFPMLLALAIPAVFWTWGQVVLSGAPSLSKEEAGGPGVRIVQADIPQREKWAPQFRARNIREHLALSVEGRPAWVKAVIWPETAVPYLVASDEGARAVISGFIPDGGYLITGAPRRDLGEDGTPRIFNSMLALDKKGDIRAQYDKSHLVPFGEYVPMKQWLPIDKVTEGSLDYTPGQGPDTVALPGLPPFSTLICYEAIFPGAVVDEENRPQWLVNLTNDAWYGKTAGPHQHLELARTRAVEEGMPMIRATNTGISAGFDAFGRELGVLGLDKRGYLDIRLPVAKREAPAYSRYGNTVYFLLVMIAILIATGLSCSRRPR